ncbi:formate-tetrahydrofolate ligase [Acrasis kona]|uniref:formate--tetrahydrofolate ligase n=1 Tax=Acrasis kona TaxID=1008807 RepID=A0AAW2ZL37_9EUKA
MTYTGRKLEQVAQPVPNDIEISQSVTPLKITDLATKVGVQDNEVLPYGDTKAKIKLDVLDRLKDQTNGKYIVVTGISPTPLGEGKSTTTVGISQALGAHLNKQVFTCLRQPSMGPTFGIKGGAHGGGYSMVVPMDDFNLHMTGDIHAITAANNLMAAAIDTRMFHESTQKDGPLFQRLTPDNKFSKCMLQRLKKLSIDPSKAPNELTDEEKTAFARLDIDPSTIAWNRVSDVCDRYLREITIGQSKTEQGRTRTTSFDISVASEVMAILALCDNLQDMRARMGRITVAYDNKQRAVTAEDLGVAGAMTVLMRDAIMPTLMQTIEGTPVLVHAGPFANIAHGNSSIIADRIALKLAGANGYVLTEAGFGADMGMVKFFDIKCRTSGLKPDCVVLVASVRAIKFHAGEDLKKASSSEQIKQGSSNMIRHIENAGKFGVNVVVCLNKFKGDTDEEIAQVIQIARDAGAFDAVVSDHWAQGGKGAVDVSESIVKACEANEKQFTQLYDLQTSSISDKVNKICKDIFGASSVEFSQTALQQIERFESQGLDKLPICISKTQYSFSHDANLKGAPSGFVIPVREIRCYSGAGFLVPMLGEISTMPGLPTKPAYYDIDIDEDGKILGLF